MRLVERLHSCCRLWCLPLLLPPPHSIARPSPLQQPWTTGWALSSFRVSPPPPPVTAAAARAARSTSRTGMSSGDRRQRAAQAAEQRLRAQQATATATAVASAAYPAASSSSSSSSAPIATATATAAASSKSPSATTTRTVEATCCSSPETKVNRNDDDETSDEVLDIADEPHASRGGKAGSRKRPAEQISFSDSDNGGDEEVTCVGVSASERGGTRGGCGGRKTAVAVFSGRGGLTASAATTNKRGRKNEASGNRVTAAAASALGARAAGRPGDASTAAAAATTGGGGSSLPPNTSKTFRVVSWNIDCLNGENKMARVEEVCAILLEAEPTPDVILLQEVDGEVIPVLNARLGVSGLYRAHPPRVPVESRYFTLAFIKASTVTVLDSGREVFRHSRMDRDLAFVRATFNGKPVLIMTSHLESEKQSSEERKAQFNQALRRLLGFRDGPAIFAGDTNLREAEVKQEKLAKEAGDAWQLCGADSECRFTWDMAKNDNHVFGGGFQPRARYDRMFVNPQAKGFAKSFALLGTRRMAPPHSCFPSDHFGIDVRFEW